MTPQERDAEVIPGIYAETILPDEQYAELPARMAEYVRRSSQRRPLVGVKGEPTTDWAPAIRYVAEEAAYPSSTFWKSWTP